MANLAKAVCHGESDKCYLAAHSPTERALLQTADIAARLSRGDRLHENA
jgi:hypothetical protein